jgi:hypothetical protein
MTQRCSCLRTSNNADTALRSCPRIEEGILTTDPADACRALAHPPPSGPGTVATVSDDARVLCTDNTCRTPSLCLPERRASAARTACRTSSSVSSRRRIVFSSRHASERDCISITDPGCNSRPARRRANEQDDQSRQVRLAGAVFCPLAARGMTPCNPTSSILCEPA